jgi:hypothetical protein
MTVRDCFDINACGTSDYKPKTLDDCSIIFPSCYDRILTNDETDIDCGGKDCMPCSEGKYCLQDSDCMTLYCSEGKCSIIPNIEEKKQEQPAIKTPKIPYYSYGLFFLILASLILIIFVIMHAHMIVTYYQEHEFKVNLSNYLEKKSMPKIDEEIDLEIKTPEKEKKKLQKEIKKIDEEKRKESAKWLETDSIKVQLPLQKKRQKEAEPSLSELRKKHILDGLKAVYECSYE